MASNYDNFKTWFKDILDELYSNRNAGFIILIVTFPLLERYLREKSGVYEEMIKGGNKATFCNELIAIFPELKSAQDAEDFWKAYRNGLLHQVTISKWRKSGIDISGAWVSNDSMAAVSKSKNGFLVHPAKLSERVIKIIEKDFSTFEGHHSKEHPLPDIRPLSNHILGTGTSDL